MVEWRRRSKAKASGVPPLGYPIEWRRLTPSRKDMRLLGRAYRDILDEEFQDDVLEDLPKLREFVRESSEPAEGEEHYHFDVAIVAGQPMGVVVFWWYPQDRFVVVDYMAAGKPGWIANDLRRRAFSRTMFLHLAQRVCEFLTRERSWRYVLFEAERVRLGDSYWEEKRRISRICNFQNMCGRFEFMERHELYELPIAYLAPPVKLQRGADDVPCHLMLVPNRREPKARILTKSEVRQLLSFVYLRYYGEAASDGDISKLSGVGKAYYFYLKGLLERVMRCVPETVTLQTPEPCPVAVLMHFRHEGGPDPAQDPIFQAIRSAVKGLAPGFDAMRIDEMPADDWIERFEEFAHRCSLVIIDLSGGRPALEYELGYVRALGKPVLALVSEEWSGRLSGYARKASIVRYRDANDLRKILPQRLKGMLGWQGQL